MCSVFAHGIGGRSDLPLDLSFFLVGAGVVILISFVALALLWPRPRLQDGPHERVLNAPWHGPISRVLSALGLAAYALVLVAGLAGRNNGSENITPVMIWVLVWLIVPFAAGLFGNVWAAISPWRTMTRIFSFAEEDPSAVERVGIYPATFAFITFVWLELISPSSGDPRALAGAMLAYSVYVFAFASWAGPESGLRVSEFFATYIRLISSIAPFGRNEADQLVWRGWLRALPATQHVKGLTLFVLAMIGTVTYDGLSGTPWWNETVGSLGLDPSSTLVQTGGLLATIAAIALAYFSACWISGRSVGSVSTRTVAERFTHTLVPIAFAYGVAHYFTLIIFEGQLLYIHASDPLGLGWNLFGTADWAIQFWLTPTATWYVQVVAIVLGHVAGVVLAHDRALADFDAEVAVRSQYAMLGLMILLTGLGLTILAVG
jgi:hypothetical protein